MHNAVTVAAVILATLATAGCSATGIDALDREQAEGDRLPQAVIDVIKVNPATTRFLAADEGINYFVASSDGGNVCLVAYPEQPEADPVAYCSPGGHITISASSGADLELIPRANEQREGWHKLAPNFYAQED